jgi:Leucine Rich repeat
MGNSQQRRRGAMALVTKRKLQATNANLKKRIKDLQKNAGQLNTTTTKRLQNMEFYSIRNKYSEDDLQKLLSVLINHYKIRVLELGGGLTDKACKVLAAYLPTKKCSFVELQLQGNDITDDGVKILCDALLNSHVERLDLSWNNIGDIGAKYLADTIRKSACLKSVDLAYNRCTEVGAAYLQNALRNSRLRRLTLSGNEKVSRGMMTKIDQTISMVNSERFHLAEALCSGHQVERIGRNSWLKDIPIDLIREVVDAIYGPSCTVEQIADHI